MKTVIDAIMALVRLAELRGILKFLQATQQTTTYVPIAKTFGLFSGGTDLAHMLGEIQDENHQKKEPLLPSLVVGSQSGVPGGGYFENARKLGHNIPKTPADELLFWAGQLKLLGVPYPQSAIAAAVKLGVTLP